MRINRSIITTTLVSLLVLLSACSKGDESMAWQKINQGALLVDVRTPAEFNAGHLPEASLIPVNEVEKRLGEFGDDKNRPIVVYCKSGARSGRAQSILLANGYTDVTNGGGYQQLMSAKP